MIIDLILDRKDGEPYDAGMFYWGVFNYIEVFRELAMPITRAMDDGTEKDVKHALCDYIDKCGYNADIKTYINSVDWL